MNFPKLVIASDGRHVVALLDDVFIGQGIQRLDFSTEGKGGDMKSTIRIMDLDVGVAKLDPDSSRFSEFLEKLSGND